MSVTVPRGTRQERLSVRVPATVKRHVADSVGALQVRGVRTTAIELVEILVTCWPPPLNSTPACATDASAAQEVSP